MEQSDPVQLVADEQSRLSRELRDLPAAAWSAPSRCGGWSNATVLGHLTFGSVFHHESVTRALHGNASAPAGPNGQALTVEEFRQIWTSRQAELAEKPCEELLDLFDQHGRELVKLYQSLSPADSDKPAWHTSGLRTIGWFVAIRSFELGFHGWDIRAALDPKAAIRPELLPFLLGLVRQVQLLRCRPEPYLEGTCRFEVDGQSWTNRVRNGAFEDAPADTPADATIRVDANTYLLLATSRKALSDLSGQITIGGDRRRAEQLLSAACFQV